MAIRRISIKDLALKLDIGQTALQNEVDPFAKWDYAQIKRIERAKTTKSLWKLYAATRSDLGRKAALEKIIIIGNLDDVMRVVVNAKKEDMLDVCVDAREQVESEIDDSLSSMHTFEEVKTAYAQFKASYALWPNLDDIFIHHLVSSYLHENNLRVLKK